MMFQRIGRGPMETIGFGMLAEPSLIRRPRPPQKRTTFIGGRSIEDLQLRNRDDKARAPGPCIRQLSRDLFPEVPREDEDEGRPGLVQPLRLEDRDVRAGQEASVLVRIAIDRVLEEVRTNTAVVEERVALSGCTVAHDRVARAFRPDQELEERALRLLDARREAAIRFERAIAGLRLKPRKLRDAAGGRMASVAMAHIEAKRSPV